MNAGRYRYSAIWESVRRGNMEALNMLVSSGRIALRHGEKGDLISLAIDSGNSYMADFLRNSNDIPILDPMLHAEASTRELRDDGRKESLYERYGSPFIEELPRK